jgi:hypothetical protein
VPSLNNANQPWLLLGDGTQYDTRQDHLKLKLAYDLTPTLRASRRGLRVRRARSGHREGRPMLRRRWSTVLLVAPLRQLFLQVARAGCRKLGRVSRAPDGFDEGRCRRRPRTMRPQPAFPKCWLRARGG